MQPPRALLRIFAGAVMTCASFRRCSTNSGWFALAPEGENGLGMLVDEAAREIAQLRRLFVLYRAERAIFPEWERLVIDHAVKRRAAHDARLVAAMLRHNLSHILTFNIADFARFANIQLIEPGSIASIASG